MVFGKLLEGMEVLKKIENTKTNHGDRPAEDVVITSCGIFTADTKPYGDGNGKAEL